MMLGSVHAMFGRVHATESERHSARAGDELLDPADVVMDRAFTLDGSPDVIWPWIVQLGKRRAGWYLPRSVELFVPRSRRAIRTLDPRWQNLAVGEVVPDWGGRDASFEVDSIHPPTSLVYKSSRGRMNLTWSLTLERAGPDQTRVFLRLRLAPVRRRSLARLGEVFDILTVAGMAAGLRERLADAGATT